MEKTATDREFENFMQNVKWLRKRFGLSKRHMARLLGIGVGSLNKIERGEFPPRLGINTMFRVCAQFGLKFRDLVSKRLER